MLFLSRVLLSGWGFVSKSLLNNECVIIDILRQAVGLLLTLPAEIKKNAFFISPDKFFLAGKKS
jgi:hypothetical protein